MQQLQGKKAWGWMLAVVFSVGLFVPVICFGGKNKFLPYGRPNILFIVTDDQSVPDVGIYGNPDLKTPAMNRLAKEGMLFTRMYTSAPQCAPSRGSLMTGRSAVGINKTRFSAPLRKDIITFVEVLRNLGYFTGVVGRSSHIDGTAERWEAPENAAVLNKYHLRTMKDRVDVLLDPEPKLWPHYSDKTGLENLNEFLDKRPVKKPFFVQLNLTDPHAPFDAKEYEPDPQSLHLPVDFPNTEKVREHYSQYLGEVERIDVTVQKAMDILEKRGLLSNTVVVVMGDNGAPLLRGKGSLYERGLRVPLIFWGPKWISAGMVSDIILSGEDIAPTFIEMAGGKAPASMTGVSFLSALKRGKYQERKYVFAERGAHGGDLPRTAADFDLSRTIIAKQYKLIYNAMWQIPYAPMHSLHVPWDDMRELNESGKLEPLFSRLYFEKTRPMFELYDLESDPFELDNLIDLPKYADITHQLKTKLLEWMVLNEDFVPLPLEWSQ